MTANCEVNLQNFYIYNASYGQKEGEVRKRFVRNNYYN